MIVGIEGPDLAGKTYLFNQLKKDSRFSSFRFVSLEITDCLLRCVTDLQLRDYRMIYALMSDQEDYVFDRFLVVNLIYDKIFNRISKFDDKYNLIDRAFFIHLNYDSTKKDFNGLADNFYSIDTIKKVSLEYHRYFANKSNSFNIDTTIYKPFDIDLIWSSINEYKEI